MTDHELAVQVRMDAEEVVNGLNDLNNALSNLPGSVEVDITTEDTVTPILETIQDSLETLPSDVEITISAFDDFATETITNIKDLVDGLPSEVNVTLTAEDNASDVLDSLKERLSDEFNITLNVDDNATEPITNLKELLSEIPSTVDISLNVDDNATEIVERLHGLLGDIPDEVTTTVNAEVNEGEVEDLKAKLEEIDGTTYDTTITVDTESMETATETTNTFTGAVDGLTSKVAGLTAGFFSYNKTLELLDYNRIIEQSAILTNATQSQREAMEDLIRENYVYSLGMKGTASVMYTLAAYTNDVNLTMGYFKAALLGVKRSGEDASTVTLALARVFRDFNVSVQDSTDTVNLLLGLWRVSGYPSFTQFIDTVDRLGYFFKQAGLNVEDTARIIASVGPIGTRILRPFARDLAEISSSWVEGGESVKEYSDKLEGFGVAVRDAHGNLRPFKDVLFDFIEVLASIPDEEERVRVATEVFGESVGPALAQVASNWKTTGKVTEEESERMNKALGKSAEKHRDFLGWIRYYLDQFAMWLNDFFGDMGLIGEALLVGLFSKAAEYLAEGLKRLVPRVTGAIRKLLSDGFDELKKRLPEELSRRLIDTLSEGFKNAKSKAKDIIKGFIDTIKRILGDEIKKTLE
ncbi:phage tail tape measure protein, partial [Methanothermobacter marburgensis]|uniref:phage tail tape measure protein n=1 Tax=Methanothermobacter marburgensis TaxID=145263 RepID=UPI0035BA6D8D